MISRRSALALMALLGCRATTARPSFDPFPEAEHGEIGFGLEDKVATVMRVTDTVVAYLKADSIPVDRVRAFDGYLETGWFDAGSLQPTGRRPLGDSVVKVRAWVQPGKPGYAKVEIETAYRPMADPSLPARELEAPVAALHPVNKRISATLDRLKSKYGVPEEDSTKLIKPGNRPPPVPRDTTKADSARADSTRPDSVRTDTTAAPAVPDSARVDTTRADTTERAAPPPTPPPPAPPPAPRPDSTAAATPAPTADAIGIWVQAVAAATQGMAEQVLAKVKALGYQAWVIRRDQLFLVRAGPFPNRQAATAAIARIKPQVGGEPFLVVNNP